eukprot:scaffold898_cov229-Pinguiococcus_pyrenoidosus.AAC.11
MPVHVGRGGRCVHASHFRVCRTRTHLSTESPPFHARKRRVRTDRNQTPRPLLVHLASCSSFLQSTGGRSSRSAAPLSAEGSRGFAPNRAAFPPRRALPNAQEPRSPERQFRRMCKSQAEKTRS